MGGFELMALFFSQVMHAALCLHFHTREEFVISQQRCSANETGVTLCFFYVTKAVLFDLNEPYCTFQFHSEPFMKGLITKGYLDEC